MSKEYILYNTKDCDYKYEVHENGVKIFYRGYDDSRWKQCSWGELYTLEDARDEWAHDLRHGWSC